MSSSAPAKKGSRLFPSEVMSPPMPAYALRAGEGAHLADSAPGNRQGRRSPRPDRLHSGAGTSLGRRRTPPARYRHRYRKRASASLMPWTTLLAMASTKRRMHQTTVRFGKELWEALELEADAAGVSVAPVMREAAVARLGYAAARRGDPNWDRTM